MPPSGHIAGIYARSDSERGVHKAPANVSVRGVLGLEKRLTDLQQGPLNLEGINVLRIFPGEARVTVWGARTTVDKNVTDWLYVPVRRLLIFIEQSIEEGIRWAVFEPNGEALWYNIQQTISSFLYNEWVSGALLGATQQEAFFVRCDRTTMTQADLDNGRLICLVGVAAIKPAEFVIFRIGQKTADAKS